MLRFAGFFLFSVLDFELGWWIPPHLSLLSTNHAPLRWFFCSLFLILILDVVSLLIRYSSPVTAFYSGRKGLHHLGQFLLGFHGFFHR